MKLIKTTILAVIFTFMTGTAYAGPVNINTANADNLAVNIKGVGKKKAEAIIAYREANGPFKSVQELIKVKGIGEKLVQKNRDNLLISSN
jgi:competence protein ComEA